MQHSLYVNVNVNICNALEFPKEQKCGYLLWSIEAKMVQVCLSCDRNEPTLEAARIVAGKLFQTLGAAIEKRRDAVLVLERGTDSMSRDDEQRLRVGLYCSSSDAMYVGTTSL